MLTFLRVPEIEALMLNHGQHGSALVLPTTPLTQAPRANRNRLENLTEQAVEQLAKPRTT